MKATYEQIKSWMNNNINEYVDSMVGELDCTALAEACADHFNEGDNVPELYYDIAVDVEGTLLGNSFD